MEWKYLSPIIAAIITAFGTVLAARFNDIVDFFKKASRNIVGDWDGTFHSQYRGIIDDESYEQPREPDGKYIVNIMQSGRKVKGSLIITDAPPGIPHYHHKIKGYIKGSYFIYDCFTVKQGEEFKLSKAILYISDCGKKMRGHFVATAGDHNGRRTFSGFAILKKR